MKSILDANFRYTPSFDTDVRRTFERVRRQQRVKPPAAKAATAAAACRVNVLAIEQHKKLG